jgi:hypothetical protein
MMGGVSPEHVEQLRNIGIINYTTRLHLVGSFYEISFNHLDEPVLLTQMSEFAAAAEEHICLHCTSQ